jgi:ribosomal protein S17E
MQIDEPIKQMIRETVVEMFKETVEENFDDNQILMLNEWLQEIMSKKIDKYNVNVYGVSLQEGF